ncbi:hypothetical protein AVEN_172961-1 [Araneus ventricosus]|uniref:Uncharacterized protein n=1 Tax=Araneus ventricosus TaxID=182803 RepID=A0A4Y2FV02_ARAVE|nr:hypothetical protein AVEN_172961-1 [Araneus ventricosus]
MTFIYIKIIEEAEKDLIVDMCNFLRVFYEFREEDLEPKSVEFWRKELVDHVTTDDLLRTYMDLNPFLQTCQLLKWKLMKVLEVFPNYANIEDMEPEFHKPWVQIWLELIEKLKKQREKFEEKYGMFPSSAEK